VDDELLDDYVLKRTDDYASKAVAQHLAECGRCRAKCRQLADLRMALAFIERQITDSV
jgi:hypothetical protein